MSFPSPSPLARGGGGDGALCEEAIRAAEERAGTPPGLLRALALAEAGRRDPATGGAVPWPWTVNAAGDARRFATRAEAVAWVGRLRRAGRRNIDVGCVQVNLLHHPRAFASLERAFDPAANVAYGAGFLAALRAETGSWDRAVERYHTAVPVRGRAYRARVQAHRGEGRPAGAVAAAGEGGPAMFARTNLTAWRW